LHQLLQLTPNRHQPEEEWREGEEGRGKRQSKQAEGTNRKEQGREQIGTGKGESGGRGIRQID
jgi:hypothetical protein